MDILWLTFTQSAHLWQVAAPTKLRDCVRKIITDVPWKPQGWPSRLETWCKKAAAVHEAWTSALKTDDPDLSQAFHGFSKKKESYSWNLIKYSCCFFFSPSFYFPPLLNCFPYSSQFSQTFPQSNWESFFYWPFPTIGTLLPVKPQPIPFVFTLIDKHIYLLTALQWQAASIGFLFEDRTPYPLIEIQLTVSHQCSVMVENINARSQEGEWEGRSFKFSEHCNKWNWDFLVHQNNVTQPSVWYNLL